MNPDVLYRFALDRQEALLEERRTAQKVHAAFSKTFRWPLPRLALFGTAKPVVSPQSAPCPTC